MKDVRRDEVAGLLRLLMRIPVRWVLQRIISKRQLRAASLGIVRQGISR
jgi:hypothetical protein